MSAAHLVLPNFNPVAISIGPIDVRWYSLAYITGILLGWFMLKTANDKDKIMSEEALENWLIWAILGIIIGGRLGYILFYNLGYYLYNPFQILAVWEGGMSFHGGLLGAIIAMVLFCNKYKIKFLKLTDILAVAAPIGLFFGRISNFINLELYGRVTESKFGVIFPNGGSLPRHPSQLYEASLEGILSFIILFYLAKFTKIKQTSGALSGLFLVLYGLSRMFVELFREPDEHIGLLFGYNITMGQILSIPLIIIGLVTMAIAKGNSKTID